MRLLFIYFYKKFGTFEKGSIIHLSKKYKFTINEKKSTENEFYFNKEENLNFIEDFYSNNIDIGVLIGENGTGKSVLLNSIRDKNNDYSICVYEEGNRFYCFSNQKQIFIENLQIIKKELNYIYYTSLIDAFDNDINDKYNISNRAFLKKFDGKNLDVKLSLIENDDIQKYFIIGQKINYGVEINGLKINYNDKFFSQLKEKIIQDKVENIYPFYIEIIKDIVKKLSKNDIKIDDIFNLLANSISDRDLLNHMEKFEDYYLLNDDSFLNLQYDKLFRKINSKINKEFRSEYNQLSIDTQVKSNINENLIIFLRERPLILGDIKNKNDYSWQSLDINLQKAFQVFLETNDIYKFFSDTNFNKIFYFVESCEINNDKILFMIYKLFIGLIFNENSRETRKKIKFLEYKYLVTNFIKYIMDYPKLNSRSKLDFHKLKVLKLQFDINESNYNYFTTLDNELRKQILKHIKKEDIRKIYFNIVDKDTKKFLLILFFEEKYLNCKDLGKIELINIFISILDSDYEVINDGNILNNLEHNSIFNQKLKFRIKEDNKLEVNADFFDFYKKLIEYELKPFTYELYPSLSSGQKAILFIFARINDAIQKINQENPDENILILLDEADLKLHLEWQRQFLYDLVEFLNSYSNNKFYVLYATHSPMILSDITNDRVVFLKKKDEKYSEDKQDFTKSTFGANIYDIYSDSFFVKGIMGEFAQNKINDVIKIIDEYKEKKEKNPDEFMPNEKALDNLKIVKNIGEPLLRNKLEDEIKSLVKDDIMEIVNNLKNKKNEEIEKDLEKYSQFTQTKVLMKLLEIRK